MPSPIIMKFGGTSMKDADTIRRSASIARSAAPAGTPVVAVVSAMDQVTELLLDSAAAAAAGDHRRLADLIARIREKHLAAANAIGGDAPARITVLLNELESILRALPRAQPLSLRNKDAVVARGEMLAAALMSAAMGCRALTGEQAGLITNDTFGRAEPIMPVALPRIRATLTSILAAPPAPNDQPPRVVVAGFIAATQDGITTTLGRGGSDYTACILGAALSAQEVWLWSDVDGLMSADPRLVPSARLLDTLSFAEAIEMGQFGAKSMHPLALEPAAEHNIPVRFRNTFNPTSPGTLITPVPPTGPRVGASSSSTSSLRHSVTPSLPPAPVKCCLLYRNASLINIAGAAMIGRPGTAARIFTALADAQINVMMISQSVSEAGISLVITKDHREKAEAALKTALLDPGHARAVTHVDDIAVVAAVGSGMHGTPGIAAKLFSAVAARSINVIAIAQGSSELSISFVVEAKDGPAAVRALHETFVS